MDDPAHAGSTRAAFLRRFAGSGAALVLGGSGTALSQLLDAAPAGAGAFNPHDTQHFRSRPDLRPPAVTVLHRSPGAAAGKVFLAPSSGPGQRGVLILDEQGEVVWFKPTTPKTAMNFRPAVYHGKPVLTWWEGKAEAGLGIGEHVMLDDSYREIARFPAGKGRQSDLHEFVITPQSTALVTSYETRTMDTSAYGGTTAGEVVGGVVQELHLPTGRVLFEWKSLDHVGLEESHQTVGDNFFDYFHINSIELDGAGDLIVSARNTWAVYKISRKTGDVIWRLGGKRSDFAMGKGTVFAWQHDARVHDGGRVISLFDDASFPLVETQSRALVIELDTTRKRATLLHQYTHHPGRLISKFMGNTQVLDNGNVFVGWGGEPFLTEFDPHGAIVFDARLPDGGQNYRAFRYPWVGKPAKHPRIARAGRTLFVSWNGATEVASWQLETGTAKHGLQPQLTVPKDGFETKLTAPVGTRHARAVALDATGRPLGASPVIPV